MIQDLKRSAMETVGALLAAAVAADPGRPVITYYDDRSGERTELSAATLDNWVAKTANLLVDGLGLGPEDRATVDLPPHWQTAAVLLGCWSAGLAVTAAAPGSADVVFAVADRAGRYTGEVYGLALAPFAAPMRDAPAGVADYVVEVRGYGDHFTPPAGIDQRDLIQAAAGRGLSTKDRVLIDAGKTTDPVDWLLAPLAAGASTVVCAHFDVSTRDSRIATERVTVDWTAA
jgi:uncharacterized protein (TIGR03089 family)